MTRLATSLALFSALLCACSDSDSDSDSETMSSGGKADGHDTEIEWESEDFGDTVVERALFPVPLDPRSDDAPGAHLEVYRISSSDSDAPSIVFLQGGPGGDVGELLGYFGPDEPLETLREDYHVYLVNSRALGERADDVCLDLPDGFSGSNTGAAALARCVEADASYLRHVSTETTALDLDRLRDALGLERWSMYGVSYGTGVAAAYAELYPNALDALILDGVLDPLEDDVLGAGAEAALDSFALLRLDCAAEPECPDEFATEGMVMLEDLLERAETGEWTLETEDFDGTIQRFEVTRERLLTSIVGVLSNTEARLLLPQVIVDAWFGDDSTLAEFISPTPGPARADLINVVVVCRELWRELQPAEPDEETIFGNLFRESYDAMCPDVIEALGVEELPHPQSSGVRTLLLSGEGDDRTPPRWGDAVAERFENSTHAVLKRHSHGVVDSPCGSQLFRDFLAGPGALDLSCVDEPAEWPSGEFGG